MINGTAISNGTITLLFAGDHWVCRPGPVGGWAAHFLLLRSYPTNPPQSQTMLRHHEKIVNSHWVTPIGRITTLSTAVLSYGWGHLEPDQGDISLFFLFFLGKLRSVFAYHLSPLHLAVRSIYILFKLLCSISHSCINGQPVETTNRDIGAGTSVS